MNLLFLAPQSNKDSDTFVMQCYTVDKDV